MNETPGPNLRMLHDNIELWGGAPSCHHIITARSVTGMSSTNLNNSESVGHNP